MPNPATPTDPALIARDHSLLMWCDDHPACQYCTETGEGECLEIASENDKLISGECRCGKWSARGDLLDVEGWFNTHLRHIARNSPPGRHHPCASRRPPDERDPKPDSRTLPDVRMLVRPMRMRTPRLGG
ncbi:hypothetical protein D7D52_36025 [Nocardia yunnanensis]|uniref:Uncharacterized protein n=1 Tax=Nocardia yunnanensis TaxID=2382165 RepID=A0A386ZLP0_9NOCA|nr:hypothetical protein [Nocardia yunnanensis]AYF78348.1 hypothetical protein D7D52_36025 [Nocardia yunnanensis]